MAKQCINCGCKVGFINGEHFDGLLCDPCYMLFDNMTIFNLDMEKEPEKYIEAYRMIAERVDKTVVSEHAREQIKQAFYGEIDARYRRRNGGGLGMQEYIQKEQAAKQKELNRINYANSFNEFYEYDVVTLINENHGTVDKEKMMQILSEHARNGWKLHTMYSNELGKNALSLLGFGVNSTACEDVMIFERRIERIE